MAKVALQKARTTTGNSMRGSKRSRTPGSWQLRVHYVDDNGNPRWASKTVRGTASEADTHLRKLVHAVESGHWATGQQLAKDWISRYVEDKCATCSPTTSRKYRALLSNVIIPGFGNTRLADISAPQLENLYRANQGASRLAHILIKGALAKAVRQGLIERNVALVADVPASCKRANGAQLTPEGLQAMRSYAQKTDPVLGIAISLAALSGLRRGELVGLRWSNWDGEILRVEDQIVVLDGLLRKDTKSHTARSVALGGTGREMLEAYRAGCIRLASTGKRAYPFPDAPLLSRDGRTPIHPDVLGRQVSALATKCGLPGVHLHSLRHFTATQMVSRGTDIRTVAARLGHADPAMTLRVYAHAIPGNDSEAADTLGQIIGLDEERKEKRRIGNE